MKITVLVDNNTLIGKYYKAEPAFSLLLEVDKKKILFDAGYSEIFIENAQKMNESLLDLDYIVLSHGHLDHTWGLIPLIRKLTEAVYFKQPHKKPELIAHPEALTSKTYGDFGEVGSLLSKEKLAMNFMLNLNKKPFWITNNLVFLGEINRQNDFEGMPYKSCQVKNNELKQDLMLDDTALAYKSNEGITIITGCSHSGICNIIEQAKNVCNDDRIVDVIGGFHLLNSLDELIENTISYFKKQNIKQIHPCHCTDFYAKSSLAKHFEVTPIGVGSIIQK